MWQSPWPRGLYCGQDRAILVLALAVSLCCVTVFLTRLSPLGTVNRDIQTHSIFQCGNIGEGYFLWLLCNPLDVIDILSLSVCDVLQTFPLNRRLLKVVKRQKK